ncbi:hypothetical protein PFNF135_05461 [Plasmodium falciparum NF135/5.C10]|uniref:Surface antigen n=1 Tax=Plasmodium falciparum NF135/5.C10 TaxID=1036726 RepID=W4I959_PLAFA|nr:hypothetical protein PFNF135_05461 [Plasmodium falciparum NF135/5.C10]
MKLLHYCKVLLFSLPLNILVHNKNKLYITPQHTRTNRLLCECELYAPSNYENDPEMKEVMQDFDRQISQRLEEYNKGVIKNRQKCKEKCDKEVQKIILKDKIEKELTEKFATLDTHITTNDIPTCVCKKSFTDKTEKFCHKCGCGIGGVAASVGLFGGLGAYGWKSAATATAIAEGAAAAKAAGEAVRIPATIDAIISGLEQMGISILNGQPLKTFFSAANVQRSSASTNALVKKTVETIVSGAPKAAETAVEAATKEAIKASTDAVESTYAICQTAIISSIVAIVVIVIIMVIIYLILRYRRKKKMKKKLQYTKLLNE